NMVRTSTALPCRAAPTRRLLTNSLQLRLVAVARSHRWQFAHAQGGADLVLDLTRQGRAIHQELTGIVLTLADALAVVAVPRARLLDDLVVGAQVQDFAFARG